MKRFYLLFIVFAFIFSAWIENYDFENGWEPLGTVLENGPVGTWDHYLYPCSVVKKVDTYFMYYVGYAGLRSDPPWADNKPKYRKLGVATSKDGITWVKHAGNPILTYQPNPDNQEEGVLACVAYCDDNVITLYIGVMDGSTPTSTKVDCDIRLYTTTDGYTLNDHGDVLRHSDRNVVGFGDELMPRGVFKSDDGVWNLFYAPDGALVNRKPLCLAQSLTSNNAFTVTRKLDSWSWMENRGANVQKVNDTRLLFDVRKDMVSKKRSITLKSVDENQPSRLRDLDVRITDAVMAKSSAWLFDDAARSFMIYSYDKNQAVKGYQLNLKE